MAAVHRSSRAESDLIEIWGHIAEDDLLAADRQHIANANKVPHIRRINALLGYETPQLVTPLELLSPDE